MTQPNGGDLLVETLRGLGVDTVFGIVSVHNLPLVEAVDRDLRFVPVRHEAAAVNAADGYARATGRLGCALTSTGTGAGNAAAPSSSPSAPAPPSSTSPARSTANTSAPDAASSTRPRTSSACSARSPPTPSP